MARPQKPKTEANRTMRKQVESIKKQRIAASKVVSLGEFRALKQAVAAKSILVVDDDEVMRNALKRILEHEGFNVLMAEDGLELSKYLESSRFDMILLDVNLPWVDGYELCRIMKEHHALKTIPVVMVSARKTQDDVEKGFAAGANDYVTKPFDIDTMVASINRMLLKESV